MSKEKTIPLERAHELLEVDPASNTGLRWKYGRSYTAKAGDEAGWLSDKNYYKVSIDNRAYRAHRVVFALSMGAQIPEGLQVDHINNVRTDNRLENLRLVSPKNNARKQLPRKGGTSQYKGVGWLKRDKKFRARIKVDGKEKSLGHFEDEIEAARAYNKAAVEYFGLENCVLNNV